MKLKDFSWDKVDFSDKCPEEIGVNKIVITDQRYNCQEKENGDLGIVQLADAGLIYLIKNDKLCDNYELGNYYYPQSLKELKIENLEDESFCKSWITAQ